MITRAAVTWKTSSPSWTAGQNLWERFKQPRAMCVPTSPRISQNSLARGGLWMRFRDIWRRTRRVKSEWPL